MSILSIYKYGIEYPILIEFNNKEEAEKYAKSLIDDRIEYITIES